MSKGGLTAFLKSHKMAHDEGIVVDLMERMDLNHDSEVDLNEFISVLKGCTELEMAFKSCNFERALASCFKFPAGTPESTLKRFLDLSDEQVDSAVSDSAQLISHLLKGLLHTARVAKKNQPASGGGAKYKAVFEGGTQDDFYDGVRRVTGDPDPDLEEGMRTEHMCMDAKFAFSTNNYGVTTNPKLEYEAVVEMLMKGGAGFQKGEALTLDDGTNAERIVIKGTKRCRKNCQRQPDLRVLRSLSYYGDFKEDGWLVSREERDTDTPVRKLVKKANLSRPEIVVIICYSGPLFILYNGVLRGFGSCGAVAEDVEFGSDRFWQMIDKVSVKDLMARAGHSFPNTIHLLVSAVKKLQMCAENGQGKTVYRGLAGLDLTKFKKSHGFSESVFLSTTSNLDVALEYSGVKQNLEATVLAISLSQIDNGAEIFEFSQYPSEKETLINACSFCEYIRGNDEIRMTQWGPVRVLHVKVNANSRAETREELEDRRKKVVVNMLDVVVKDVRRELRDRVQSHQFRQRADEDRDSGYREVRVSVVLPAMMPEQQLDHDAQERLKHCIAAATGVKDSKVFLRETEAVAARTMLPVTVAFNHYAEAKYNEAAAQAAAEGLAADKIKAALEAAGFGGAELVAPSVLSAQDVFVASILEESEARVRVYKKMPGAEFTRNNGRLAKAVSDGLALPLLARAKCDLWLHSDPEDGWCNSFSGMRKHTLAQGESASLALRRAKLAAAREAGNVRAVRALAKQHCVFSRWISGEDALDEKDEYTQLTPLFTHCLLGNTIIVQALLEAGADACAVNADGKTPLIWAAWENKLEVVLAIIEVLVQFKDLIALNAQDVSLLICHALDTHTLAHTHTCTKTHIHYMYTHAYTQTHKHIQIYILSYA
jgi:hypothetical protein